MSENQGKHLLAERDFVDVINEDDEVVGSVPKHWGEEQLAPGLRKKSGRRSGGSSQQSQGSGGQGSDPSVEPAGNASTDAWVAYARHQGATDADLVDDQGEPLGRDELREKYGTPPE